MTKLREPLTFEHGLARIAGLIGWDSVARICRQSERTVRNWSDPDTSASIRIDDALALDIAWQAAGGEGAPMLQVYMRRLELEAAAACGSSAALSEKTSKAAKEAGEAIAALVLAARPGATPADKAIAKREAVQAIDALTSTVPMLDAAGALGGTDAGPGGPQ